MSDQGSSPPHFGRTVEEAIEISDDEGKSYDGVIPPALPSPSTRDLPVAVSDSDSESDDDGQSAKVVKDGVAMYCKKPRGRRLKLCKSQETDDHKNHRRRKKLNRIVDEQVLQQQETGTPMDVYTYTANNQSCGHYKQPPQNMEVDPEVEEQQSGKPVPVVPNQPAGDEDVDSDNELMYFPPRNQQRMTMEEFSKLWRKDVNEIYKILKNAKNNVQVARNALEKYMPKMKITGYQLFSGDSHKSLSKRIMHVIKAQPTLEGMYACALQSMDDEVSLDIKPRAYYSREEAIRVALLSLMAQCTAACGDAITSSMPQKAAGIIQKLFGQNENALIRILDAYFCDGTSNWEEGPVAVGLPEYTASALYAKNKQYPGFFESHTKKYKCQNPCRRLSSDGFGIPAAVLLLLLCRLTLVNGQLILSISKTEKYNLNQMLQSDPLVLYHILHVLTMSMHIGWHSVLSLLEKNGVAPHYDHYDGGFTRENPRKIPQYVISVVQFQSQLTRVVCHKDTGKPVSYDDWMDFVEWHTKKQNECGYPRLETQEGTGKVNVHETRFLDCLEEHGHFTFGSPNCEGFVEGEDNVIVLNLAGRIHAGPPKFKQLNPEKLCVRVLFCPSGMFVDKVPAGIKRKRK